MLERTGADVFNSARTVDDLHEEGFQPIAHPPVTHECREYDERSDHAACAMCQVLARKGLHPHHADLTDDPRVQESVEQLFMELIKQDFGCFTCPFPEDHQCQQRKQLPRPPSR